MAGGRPNKYETHVKPKLADIEAWARSGLTQEQIAKNLGVGATSFKAYIKQYPDLDDALKRGMTVAVTEVENALFRRALGYDYIETKEHVKKDEHGNLTKTVEKHTRHIPPDVAACFIILKNKDRGNWSDNPMKLELDREIAEWRKELEEKKAFF